MTRATGWIADSLICLLLLSATGTLLAQNIGWGLSCDGYRFLPYFEGIYGRSALWNAENGTPFSFYVEGEPYTHHPSLLITFLQLSHQLTNAEWFTHAVPFAFTLATALVLYVSSVLLWTRRVAVLTVIGFGLTPMTVIFGNFVNFEPPGVFFVVLSWALYVSWVRSGQQVWLFATATSLFVGCAVDWPVYFLVFVLSIHGLMVSKKNGLRAPLLFATVGVVSFGVFLVHVSSDTGTFAADELLRTLTNRVGLSKTVVPMVPAHGGVLRSIEYNPVQWALRIGKNLVELVTVVLLCGTIAWGVLSYRSSEPESQKSRLVWLLLWPAILNTTVFNGLSWEHMYAQYYFVPGCALAAALTVDRVITWFDKAGAGWVVVLGFLAALAGQSYFVIWTWPKA